MRGFPTIGSRGLLLAGWAAVLTGVLLWPMHAGGYLLGHDLVITPDQPLDLGSIGVSSASPRAVPLDALVALAGKVLTGQVVGRLAMVVPLLAVAAGVGVLMRRATLPAQLLAVGFAVWNPYVVERLAIGQWALLWSYAALPWLVVVCRTGPSRTVWARRVLVVAAASITPTGGLIALFAGGGLTYAARRDRRETLVMVASAVLLQLPWIVPSVVSSASSTSDPAAVAAFASRGEHPGGPLLSLWGLGGIWNADVVPASRTGGLAVVGVLLLIAAWVVGYRRLRTLLGRPVTTAITIAAATGLVVAVLATVPGGGWLLREAVAHVPGAGLLRDGQKWVAPLALAHSLMLGAALDVVVARLRARAWVVVAGVLAVCLPVLLLPDGASTLRPTITPVHYPADWASADRIVRGGTVAVLPFQSYRLFDWAPGRSVLDPAPRLLHTRVVVQDRLAVGGRLLGGEDPRAAEVADALRAGQGMPAALARAGIDWVLVERGTPGEIPATTGLQRVFAGPALQVYRVPGPVRDIRPSTGAVVAAVGADSAVALLVLAALATVLGQLLASARNRRRRVLPSSNSSR